jgi:membrane associated rhomboid family serine protease
MFIPLKDENPTRRFPIVTFFFISANVLIFLIQMFSTQGLQYHVFKMGAIPYEITHFKSLTFMISQSGLELQRLWPPLTLLASMFLHGSLFHLLGNMLYLWIFGNNVEDYLGPIRFLLFYVLSGLGAAFTHILTHPNSQVPMIGASGAIAGILGAYLLLFPSARVITLVFITIVPIPAAIILIIWFVGQIMNVGLGGGVAWFAHIGGFLIGMGLISRYIKKERQRVEIIEEGES